MIYIYQGDCLKVMQNLIKQGVESYPFFCKDNPDCYYKQLKRKEQECEELKEKAKELRQGWINCDNERNLQEANSEFNQRVINRYKQALIEIEEIAKNMNTECFYNDFDCKDCDMKNGCTYQGKTEILQKIKEVE